MASDGTAAGGAAEGKKSYLSGTISAFSPWISRASSASPKPGKDDVKVEDQTKASILGESSHVKAQQAKDHVVSHRHWLSTKRYPSDCPPLEVQWFHAVDVAKRKPQYAPVTTKEKEKGTKVTAPRKWTALSANDSQSVEAAFQKLLSEDEELEKQELERTTAAEAESPKPSRTIRDKSVTVPVMEDFLFDVDVKRRELGPAYWLGPVYETRRGTWFFVEGATLKPCDENLALQLEEGYLKTTPWRSKMVSASRSSPDLRTAASKAEPDSPQPNPTQLLSHRLFGAYLNTVAMYQDSTNAWLLSDDFLARISSSFYSRFGGAHLSGTRVVRGYIDIVQKGNRDKDGKRAASPERTVVSGDRDTQQESLPAVIPDAPEETEKEKSIEPTPRLRTLERQMSSLVTSNISDPETQDREARKREEMEIRDDYKDVPGDDQGRQIDHLILVTHGIGQRLGARFATFNFNQDVNELRQTLKKVYSSSLDLQALNDEVDKLPKNCRVQVLPVHWRHLLPFPLERVKQNKRESDIADISAKDTLTDEEEQYPSLADIQVEGVPGIRNTFIGDLALDILLYQTSAYKTRITRIVKQECERIFKLFKARNPGWDGTVSLIGHSLGAAIYFDIVSRQNKDTPLFQDSRQELEDNPLQLCFNVEQMYCLGSPVGLFQMLKGLTICGRQNPNKVTLDGSPDTIDDPFDDPRSLSTQMSKGNVETAVSVPKCQQLYNIFHPSDPIAYRIEPLISPAFKTLKPQNLPYVKKSLFGAPMGQGLTGIPAMVGQSFSSMWSDFRSNVASSFLNRSLGLSAADAAKLNAAEAAQTPVAASALSVGAGTNIAAGGVLAARSDLDLPQKRSASDDGSQQATLIDGELETLYAGFQKRRKSRQNSDASLRDFGESAVWREAEDRERRLKREEAKVRALNSNGRVDYSIQEGAFDISFLASIASHLSYWNDEDVAHFMLSQLLSKHRSVRKSQSQRSLR